MSVQQLSQKLVFYKTQKAKKYFILEKKRKKNYPQILTHGENEVLKRLKKKSFKLCSQIIMEKKKKKLPTNINTWRERGVKTVKEKKF